MAYGKGSGVDWGSALQLGGSAIGAMVLGEQIQTIGEITYENAQARLKDIDQLAISMADKGRQLVRGSKRAAGRMRSMVAASNLVLEGSPLDAMEDLYQKSDRDLAAMQRATRFRVTGIKQQIKMDYMKAASDIRGATYETLGESMKTAYNLWGK